ncbi:hypothetical protein BDP27DRAFT_1329950, partial [Rhodocollybia butyracea]
MLSSITVLRRISAPRLCRNITTVILNDDALVLPSLKNATFPYIWLRDSCQSPECKHPATTQKLHNSTDFDVDIRPKKVVIIDEKSESGPGIHIEWPDGHISLFTKEFLERHSSRNDLARFRKDVSAKTWDKEHLQKSPDLFLKHEELQTPSGLLKVIDQLCKYGLLFFHGVPTTPESSITDLAHYFSSEIRETFYGRIFHVQNTNSENIAYTNLKLDLHMDLLYFQHPPRYQILHCIRNNVQGGSSIFSDSFHSAKLLSTEEFSTLSKTPVPYEYLYGQHHLHHSHPVIELDHDNPTLVYPPIKFVNYSPPFQAPLLLHPATPSTPPLRQSYLALGHFVTLLESPKHTFEYTLQEGDAVIFDNRRVLHARTAFTDLKDTSNISEAGKNGKEISRWLQGCYFEGDSMKDRGRILRTKAGSNH